MDYLTSIEDIKPGAPWPLDPDIKARQQELESFQKAFQGKHSDVYRDSFKRITRVIGNFEEVFQYGIIMNYQKKISVKTADLLLGEQPTVKTIDEKDQKRLNDIIKDSEFWNTIYEAVIDNSRFGNGVLTVYNNDGTPAIDVVPTATWTPVVDPMNIKRITQHVISWVTGEKENKKLHIQIHNKGSYITREYKLITTGYIQDKIGRLISEEEVKTGLSDFAIVPLSNLTTSDSIYGISDYEDVDSIISEIEVRVGQISKILDKHADPSVVIPESAVDINPETGEAKIRLGSAFIVDKDSIIPSYMTFNGELEAAFKQVELLLNQLAIISELGTLFLGNGLEKLGAISGAALKKLAYSALAKISRVEKKVTPKIVKALELASEITGKKIENITIAWSDSLPTDLKEIVEIANLRTGNKPTMTTEDAIKFIDDADSTAAQEAVIRIKEENKALTTEGEEGGNN